MGTHDCEQSNRIGEGGLRELARALVLNTGITNVDLSVCSRTEEGECTAGSEDGTCEHS